MTKRNRKRDRLGEQGQGLAEYALILSLVAIVVVSILGLMGPQINNVYEQVFDVLIYRPLNPLVVMNANRTGNGSGNDVIASLAVYGELNVTITDSQSGQSKSVLCSGFCEVTLVAVGHLAGTVTATSEEHSLSDDYYPKF